VTEPTTGSNAPKQLTKGPTNPPVDGLPMVEPQADQDVVPVSEPGDYSLVVNSFYGLILYSSIT
jgi:hypothetical protein